jgi:excisionase family DNA binding protein
MQQSKDILAKYQPQASTTIWNSVQAAEYLRIHPRTLTKMARNGEIPSIQIGRLWRFRQCDLDAWLTHKVNSGSLSMPPQLLRRKA